MNFQFSNLLGTVYRGGNLTFTPDGSSLLSPVGNRVTVFNLVENTSYTLPLAHRHNISRIAIDGKGNLLLTVDNSGRAILTNFVRRTVLHHFSFKSRVTALTFSPSGRHFAVGVGRFVEVWQTPNSNADDGNLEFSPFVRHHRHAGHSDTITNIQWSSDSRFFLTSSKDLTARIWSLFPEEGFEPTVLSGHRQAVRGAWFSEDQEVIYTISKDGALFEWKFITLSEAIESTSKQDIDAIVPEERDIQRWRVSARHYFFKNAPLTCATYHPETNLLITCFSNGLFTLHELPDFTSIHELSISASQISHVTANASGEWLAFGAESQLLVWEWQSESYILKQQGHLDSTNALVYSPDGTRLITASDDGKLKIWDVASGFCIVTFSEHTSGVTACTFARGNVLFTASLDGSIRAWDLIRYRCFRVFAARTRLSFTSIAVDPAGEVVCAGSLDSFDIQVWSVQTGQLLDELAGHEGPVSTLAFAQNGTLASGSWDHTVRIWSVFSRTQTSEPLLLQADVLSVAFRPDSAEVAVATLDGDLTFWSVSSAVQSSNIDARRDVSGGRKTTDRRTAASNAATKSFNSVTYSPDGHCVLAAGNSKYICLYSVETGALLHKWTVSVNLDLEGTQEFLNSRNLREAGPNGLLNVTDSDASEPQTRDPKLPGTKRGDPSLRSTKLEVRVSAVAFSPSGRSFCASSTEGLLVYSLDQHATFDPVDLDVDITPAHTLRAVKQKDYLTALVMAIRLNNVKLIGHVFTATPLDAVPHIARSLPPRYLPRLLRHVAHSMDTSPHLEFSLHWMEALLSSRGREIKDASGASTYSASSRNSAASRVALAPAVVGPELRVAQRALKRVQTELGRMADENGFRIDYLLNAPGVNKALTNGHANGDASSELHEDLTMDDLIGEAFSHD